MMGPALMEQIIIHALVQWDTMGIFVKQVAPIEDDYAISGLKRRTENVQITTNTLLDVKKTNC